MRTILLIALVSWLVPGIFTLAQVPETERTPITDPDVLQSLGLPRDAKNVYRAKAIDAGPPPETPGDWGSGSHFTAVTPAEFTTHSSGEGFHIAPSGIDCDASCAILATIHLPTGARIEAFRWWATDNSETVDVDIAVYETCHPPFSPGPVTQTQLAVGSTSGSSGDQSGVLAGSGYTVNNRDCSYAVIVDFDAGGMEFGKLRVQWKRQISPPPGSPSFADVPASHQFFAHIEALAASGITAGCGNGNFCPGAPVTRGQMAAFFAIALGLYFP